MFLSFSRLWVLSKMALEVLFEVCKNLFSAIIICAISMKIHLHCFVYLTSWNLGTVVPRYSVKKMFLKISWNSQKACNFIKKEALAQVFTLDFCKIFINTFFYRTSLVAASGNRWNHTIFICHTVMWQWDITWDTWFFADWRHHRAVTRLENVRQSNIRRGKKLGFQLSHKHHHVILL